jgi:hypothetical protein
MLLPSSENCEHHVPSTRQKPLVRLRGVHGVMTAKTTILLRVCVRRDTGFGLVIGFIEHTKHNYK